MSKSKDNGKKSFVMYASFLEAMKHLNDVEYRECMTMISEYALNGVEEKSSSPSVNIILEMAKPNLEAASRRYDACVKNGKKGAEYGKLGGAPKGNQNARKKQPLKQPLDVDLNENEEVNVDDYINEYVNNDAESTPIGLESSFNSSIQGVNNQIENNSEQFEEQEKRKEPHNEAYGYYSNDCGVGVASENTSEASLYSKDDVFVSSGTEPKTSRVGAARHQQIDEGGMSMSEYLKQVINKGIIRLADMKLQGKEYDKQLLNGTIDNMIYYDYHFDRSSAYAAIMKSIEQYNSKRSS